MRLVLAVVAGVGTAAACAIVLGDYPLSGSVPWVAAGLIPLLIGTAATLTAGAHQRALWLATGPLALGAVAWGVRIATGWGLDPVPASCWFAMGLALLLPVGWALTRPARDATVGRPGGPGPAAPPAPGADDRSVDGQLGDLGHLGRSQVGDP